MGYLYQWGLDKPHHIRICAFDIAKFSHDFQELLSSVKQNDLPSSFPEPDTKNWFRLYYKSRHLKQFIFSNLLPLDPISLKAVLVANHCHQTHPHSITQEEDEKLNRLWQDHISHSAKDIDEIMDPNMIDKAKASVISAEFYFMLQVALPCWFFYHEPHSVLFRKASKGDIHSIEKLLRLDKRLIQNPQINKWLTHYNTIHKRLSYKTLCNGLAASPKGNIQVQAVKSSIAGLISYYTEKLGHRLKAPEIESLFNCIVKDQELGLLRDEDFPDSPEAFSKLVQRQRKLWNALLP